MEREELEADVSLVDLLTAGLAAEGLEADLAAGLVGEILALYEQEGQAGEVVDAAAVAEPTDPALDTYEPPPETYEPPPETCEPSPESQSFQETPPMAKPTFHFVRRVRTSAQGGLDVDLYPKTLIVGANGTRKDAIMRAVSLAMTGRVYELGGKEVGQPVELLALAPGREGMLFAHATLDDGRVATFRTKGVEGGGKSTGTHHEVPKNLAVLLGTSKVREVLTEKGDDERRKFFLGLMGASISDARLLSTLGEPRRERFAALLAEARKADPSLVGASALTAVLALAKAEKAAAAAEAKAADTLLTKLTESAGIAPSAENLEAARVAAEAAAKAIEGRLTTTPAAAAAPPSAPAKKPQPAPHKPLTGDERVAISAQIDEVRGYLAPTMAEIGRLEAELAALGAPPTANVAQREMWKAMKRIAQEQLAGVERGDLAHCVLCAGHGLDGHGQPVQLRISPDAARTQAGHMAQTAEQWFAYLDQLDAQAVQAHGARRAEITAELDKGRAYLANVEQWLATETKRLEDDAALTAAWATWRAESDAIDAAHAQAMAAWQVERASTTIDPEAAQAVERWQELNKTYQALQSAYDKAESIQRTRSQRSRAQDAESLAERLVDECAEAIKTLLGEQRSEFVAAVQALMPAPEKMPKGGLFDLRLTEGKRDVCQIGLLKDSVLHTALSGAEWVIVTTAIAGVLATRFDCPIVIPEDRDIDPETLANAMRALTDAPCQILWGTTKTPKGRTPAGWNVIEAEKVEIAIPADEPWALPEEEAAAAAKAAAKAERKAKKGPDNEGEGSDDNDGDDDDVGVPTRSPAEAKKLAEVVDGFRAPDDAPDWWKARGQHCGWRGVTDPNAKSRGRGEPFGEAYVRLFGVEPVTEAYHDCIPVDEDGEPEPAKAHRLVLFAGTGAVARFWTPEGGEPFGEGLLYKPAEVPDWAQRCGDLMWTGQAPEARAGFQATFQSDPVARTMHDMRTGTWRQYSNGVVSYQSGTTVTFYRGGWQAPPATGEASGAGGAGSGSSGSDGSVSAGA